MNKSLNHSFSLLTGTQAVFNGTFSVLYLVYVAPMIILDSKVLRNNSEHVGFFLVLCYDISIQTHALVTVNRFGAVFLPVVYKNVFKYVLSIVSKKKEIDFLKQSFSQAIYLMIIIPSWYILPMYSNSVLTQFILGVLFWPIIHSFDGVLTLYFNVEIRKSLARKFKRQTNSVHNSVLVGGKSSTRIN
ncbi:unnamed protein product [Caenorhabditis nigoni]